MIVNGDFFISMPGNPWQIERPWEFLVEDGLRVVQGKNHHLNRVRGWVICGESMFLSKIRNSCCETRLCQCPVMRAV